VDFVASRHCVVNVGHIKAAFQRKSELIQTKTAVLNDKERELQLLEHQLAARERAILWQEHQMDVNTVSKHNFVQSPSESGNYWQHREDQNGPHPEKYAGQPTKEHHYASAVFDHYQHVRPPDSDAAISSGGWAMEKLEEQFARLVHTRTQRSDVGRTQTCVQQPSKIQHRPEMVLFYPVNQHFSTVNHQNELMHKYSNVVRKRGRPRGSRYRYSTKMPSEPPMAVGLPVRPQWLHNLYRHAQMLQNDAVTFSAEDEAVRYNLAHQTMVNCRLSGNAVTMADGRQNAPEIFTGGQLLPNERPAASCGDAEESTTSLLPTQAQPPSATSPAVTPSRVRQMLASAAFTTAASILPPLSPVPAGDFSSSVAGDSHVTQDSCQHGRSSGDDSARKDFATRLANSTAVASDHAGGGYYGAARSERATFIDRTAKCAAAHRKHVSDEGLSAGVMAADSDTGDHGSAAVQSSRQRTNHILPKVSSFDTGRCWNFAQAEHEEAASDRMITVRDSGTAGRADDGDDDHRLVVVIESD